MNKHLLELIKKSKSDDLGVANDALSDLGLLVERHTQNRYSEKDYLTLLGNDDDLYNLRLTDNEAELLAAFFFYYMLNKNEHGITLAWCLGKCYNMDILEGMKNLLKNFSTNDEVVLQLLYSINALFGLKTIMPLLLDLKERLGLPKTRGYVEELESEGFFGSIMD